MDIIVAVSSDVFKAFFQFPNHIKDKIGKFILNFQRDPMSTGINYEPIHNARDKNMKSVRIDEFYRGIVLKPEKGNVYVLLWIDRHDEAYEWAKRHKVSVNAKTGSLQVFDAVYVEETVSYNPPAPVSEQYEIDYSHISRDEMMQIGVPEELYDLVIQIHTENQLDLLQGKIPPEAWEALFMIAAGETVSSILYEREIDVTKDYNTEDFRVSLERIDSKCYFKVSANETELSTALNSSMNIWRIFLHPSQLRIVERKNSGSFRVLGGAGTGKTVVAMHRAKRIAESITDPGKKVLFTTFTKNLALDIENNLRQMCSEEVFARIEVINLDAWVSRFFKKNNYKYTIIYETEKNIWKTALCQRDNSLKVPESFYLEEWKRVIQPQGIETLEQYKKAPRTGRGTSITRSDRIKIWPVFEEYRILLNSVEKREINDAYRDAIVMLEDKTFPYVSIVVDEAQDMGPWAFKLLRAIKKPSPDDLFIVGDGHQRIYGRNRVVLSKCGIDIRGRSRKLKLNYRTTEEIRKHAVNLLEGLPFDDLDGETDNQKLYKSLTHGTPPGVYNYSTKEEQAQAISGVIKEKLSTGATADTICIAAPSKSERDELSNLLENYQIQTVKIEPDTYESGADDKVRISTLHRIKGLEFDTVILASINKGLIPHEFFDSTKDPVEHKLFDQEQRALLYVGLTRARTHAIITSYGHPSPFLG